MGRCPTPCNPLKMVDLNFFKGLWGVGAKPPRSYLFAKPKFTKENQMENTRKCGILLHPTSLPSRYGIGDLGKSAYDFVDFLEKAGQKIWQALPLCPTSFGDSPYQSFSAFAGNFFLISPDVLKEEELLRRYLYSAMKKRNTEKLFLLKRHF